MREKAIRRFSILTLKLAQELSSCRSSLWYLLLLFNNLSSYIFLSAGRPHAFLRGRISCICFLYAVGSLVTGAG